MNNNNLHGRGKVKLEGMCLVRKSEVLPKLVNLMKYTQKFLCRICQTLTD